MARPLSIKLIEERGKLVVLMSIERGAAVLDPDDVDAVIQYLSLLRASMQPAVHGTCAAHAAIRDGNGSLLVRRAPSGAGRRGAVTAS